MAGVYVHVPFCRSKCRYCDFCSRVPGAGDTDRYVRALLAELRLRRGALRRVDSLYIGGGTPSFLGAERLTAILDALRLAFALEPDCELTLEANPADVTAGFADACRAAGFNRLSLGVQAMRDEDLQFLGRTHTVAQAAAAAREVRAAGFDNLGIDLIVGLPGHTPAGTQACLRQAVERFGPEHISCYQLTCTPGTPLHCAVGRGDVTLLDDEAQADIFIAVHETLAGLGYEGYEVSNFARDPALRSRHNSGYWKHRDYLGFGPSAHSFVAPERSWNTSALDRYCAALAGGELPLDGRERLTPAQRAAELILLGLRTRDGFSLHELKAHGVDLAAEKGPVLAEAEAAGLIACTDGRVAPSLRGMALADRLAVELAPEAV